MFTKSEGNNAIVAELKNVRKHPNADRLQIATVNGDTVIVGLDAKENDVVVYFDSNLAISKEFLSYNNLFSDNTLNKDTTQKGYFSSNGKVKAQKFRGENSYGFVATISMFNYLRIPHYDFSVGVEFDKIDGKIICEKYVVPCIKSNSTVSKGKKNPPKFERSNSFIQHWNTPKLKVNKHTIPINRLIYIEEKIHGTSGRIGNCLAVRDLNIFEFLLSKLGVKIKTKEYKYFNGTRRMNLTYKNQKDIFYKGNMREMVFKKMQGLLHENEQIYFEIYGYDTNGSSIQKNFPYGCNKGEHKTMLYRVSINDEHGKAYDMSREYVYKRAEELGLEKPHLFEKYFYTGNKQELFAKIEYYTEGSGKSTLDNRTTKEGVVIWFEDDDGKWKCLKNKSFNFLELECKAKDEGEEDIEDNN